MIASERRLDSLLLRAVRNDATMQQWLLPGLMDVYVSAGIVEGLDVDKENFDKYSVRRGIADTLIGLTFCFVFLIHICMFFYIYSPNRHRIMEIT